MATPQWSQGQQMSNPDHPGEYRYFFKGNALSLEDYTRANKGLPPPGVQGADGGAAPITSPEAQQHQDDPAIAKMADELRIKRQLLSRANDFMAQQSADRGTDHGTATGPVYGDTLTHGLGVGNIAKALSGLAGQGTPQQLEKMDRINGATWQWLKEQGTGAIRGFEAGDWKTAFPHTSNYGTTNQDITERLARETAEQEKNLAFVQAFVNSGKGGYGAAQAAYDAQRRGGGRTAPAAPLGQPAARPPAPSAPAPSAPAPSAPAPQATAKQQSALKLYAGTQAPPGDRKNPFVPRSRAEAEWVRSAHPGAYILDTDGTVIATPGGR